MVVLDISVVNVALPTIERSLDFAPPDLQWVVNAYTLIFAGLLLLGGRLADLYGRKPVFCLGTVLFSAASLAGGLAVDPGMLVAARAMQGLGAAILAPATLTILTTTFAEGPARTRALAAWAAVGIAGGTAGNLIGGVLTEYLSWRWVLLVNVPIGVLVVVLAVRYLPGERPKARGPRLDVTGAVLATAGLVALTHGITQIRAHGVHAPATALPLLIAAGSLTAFLLVEARFARTPLMPLRLFASPSISRGNIVMLLAGACLNPMWFFLTLFMQQVLHYGPLQTGLAFLPHTLVAMLVGTRVTPWLMGRLDNRVLIVVGALVAAAGFAWQSRIGPNSGYMLGILGPAVVFSTGSGLLNTPITTTVTSGVDKADAGAASGLMNTTKQIGGALGLAMLVALAGPDVSAVQGAAGYGRAFLAIAVILLAVALVAMTLPAGADRRTGDRTSEIVG
ncbi:MFS transporter [Parasphingorhabdus pacifica]